MLLYEDGTVCDDEFNSNASIAICKELGFESASSWTTSYYWKSLQQSFEIKLDNVKCTGPEWSSCTYTTSHHNCGHSEDVFLHCRGGTCSSGNFRYSGLCEPCPSNTYQAHESVQESCIPCPVSSESGPGSTRCFCQAGMFWSEGVCRKCPQDMVSREGVLQCKECPSGSTTVNEGKSCSCPTGWGWIWEDQASGSCQPCLPGTYHSTLTGKCQVCPEGTSSSVSSTYCLCSTGTFWNENECQECAQGSVSLRGALKCLPCPSDATTDPTTCTCSEGMLWFWEGQSDGFCRPCMPGSYKYGLMTSCESCPPGSSSSAASVHCDCKAGRFWNGYKCEECDVGYASRHGSLDCMPCPLEATSVSGGSSCSCPVGSEWDWDMTTRGSCRPCPPGSYKSDQMAVCSFCPYGTSSNVGSSQCLCKAGKFWDGSVCRRCGGGSVSREGALTCQKCLLGSHDLSHCKCPAGQMWRWEEEHGGSCVSCVPGTYKTENMQFCRICPAGTTSLVGSEHCLCLAGQFWNGMDCVGCPQGFVSQAGALECQKCPLGSTATAGSSVCTCLAGETWNWNEEMTGSCKNTNQNPTKVPIISNSEVLIPVIAAGVLAVTCFILSILLILIIARQVKKADKGKQSKVVYERVESVSHVDELAIESNGVVVQDDETSIYLQEEDMYCALGDIGGSNPAYSGEIGGSNPAYSGEIGESSRPYDVFDSVSKCVGNHGACEVMCSGSESGERAMENVYDSLNKG